MFWMVLIAAAVVALVAGLVLRSVAKALRAGLIVFGVGIVLTLVLIYGGFMGG